MEIKPVAYIENDFDSKFAVPRQSRIAKSLISKIVFEKEYSDMNAVRGIDGFSHLWLIWGFSENLNEKHSLTVRPPRLGGNTRVGVFASRSPYRPNNLGISCVKLEKVKEENAAPVLYVSGADLKNGTPIYDIKPYISFSDSVENAVCGFTDTNEFHILNVVMPETFPDGFGKERQTALSEILENDPRPAYSSNNDSEKTYGFKFAGFEIKFKVDGDTLTVMGIENG